MVASNVTGLRVNNGSSVSVIVYDPDGKQLLGCILHGGLKYCSILISIAVG